MKTRFLKTLIYELAGVIIIAIFIICTGVFIAWFLQQAGIVIK